MKAISIRQPWAHLILSGAKTIELRTWRTRHRGPLLICSSATKVMSPDGQAACERHNLDPRLLTRGFAEGVVDLDDCRPSEPGDAAAAGCRPGGDEYAFVLSNPRKITPVRVTGALNLFVIAEPTEELVQALAAIGLQLDPVDVG